jgi:hypothetical protein
MFPFISTARLLHDTVLSVCLLLCLYHFPSRRVQQPVFELSGSSDTDIPTINSTSIEWHLWTCHQAGTRRMEKTPQRETSCSAFFHTKKVCNLPTQCLALKREEIIKMEVKVKVKVKVKIKQSHYRPGRS